MAMSWGWTPLCRIGNDRYRINSAGERSSHPSVVLSSAQCGIVPPPQLPPETSIVLTTPQQGGISSQLRPPSPTRTPVSSSGYSGSQTSTYQSATPSAEERVVRRSPRLARTSRVSYRDEGESQSRRQNQCYNPVPEQTMWNTDRSQSNSNPPASKNYSVYSYDGQVTQCLNSNSSVSIIYNNNKNIISNVSQSRYAPPLPFAKPPSFPLNSVKATPRKVTIKKLDFYEIVTTLVQEEVILEGIGPTQRTFSFILNSTDVKNLLDKKKKHPYLIQLRFCKLDGSCEQNDYYPTTHQLAVNHRLVLLPGLETMPRGTMRPMDITSLCVQNSQSCNFVTVRCLENCKLFVYVVQKYTSQDLLSSLEERTRIKEEDTVTEIKKKLQADQADEGIAAATLQISLLCPLSRIRIKLPCRASTCTHLQCFDAATYLQLNECKPKWSCPVCYQPALYKKLQIDGYFKKVIDENSNTDKIELQPDGTWALVDAAAGKKKPSQATDSTSEKNSKDRSSLDPGDKTVFLDSDDDVPSENTASKDSQAVTNPNPVPVRRSDSPEVVTLSDDDSPGGESPRVTASTYPTFNSTPAGTTTTTAENNDIGLESDLGYFNELWGGAINRQLTNNYSNFHPLEHSNHLYIPLTRTPIPASLSSSITITRKSNECRTSPIDRLHKSPPDRNKGLQEKSGSSSKSRKSKTNRVRKVDVKTTSKKNNSGDVAVRRKRRRILSASSDSSDSVSDRGKTPKSVHKHLTKKRPKNRRRDSESSEGEKSSVCSSNSKKSNSSVNLITSSDRSSSIFSSSSSSSSIFSSDSNETDHSDNSFASAGHCEPAPLKQSVLKRSVKKKGHCEPAPLKQSVLKRSVKKKGRAVPRREFGLKIPSSTSSVGNPGLDALDQPETSSRVLRSAVQRQKRKKKKGH